MELYHYMPSEYNFHHSGPVLWTHFVPGIDITIVELYHVCVNTKPPEHTSSPPKLTTAAANIIM